MAGAAMNMRAFASLALILAAAGCSSEPKVDQRPPLAGAKIGGPFALTDQNGRAVTDASYAGQYRIMYFGYTFCPDVCPVDVQNLAAGLKTLEARDAALAKRITPIFVSVDPARDTPVVLKQFVGAFDPRMVGLTGSPDAIAKIAKEYGVYYAKGEATPGGGYMVNHSRQAYLMGPDGKPLALLPQDGTPAAIADEIQRWAKS
jgi:protein SCO1